MTKNNFVMKFSTMLTAFTLTVLMVVSSIHCQTNDVTHGTFPENDTSNTLCFNPCTVKLGDKECKTICLNKSYKDGSCTGFGIPPTFKYCCCTK
ncbi:putative defensin-like protein 70 [Raphanus sativus]|uniref:Defensin-like protein 70 n=1 Tax=Raphanus sativus TaxID=3726 RepID=A0A9W3CH99_RAPSA|nr:putative defensin-like protein 70 [Raphanus sativus]